MSVHITQIEKHKFICGLFWQSLSRPRELLKEAAELAKKIDSDLMILRRDQATAQAGFAHTRDGARRNYYSLGAAISKSVALNGILYDGHKQTAHNWLGAFKLPDGMWAYFAVRDANFLPNGDFAGTKDEVLDRLHGDYGLGGWNVVLGDPELEEQGFHNFNPFRIEELLPHKKDGQIKTYSWWKIQPAQITIPWAPIAVVLAGAAIIGISGLITWKYYQKKIQEEAIVRAKEIARLEQLGKPLPNAFPHPWPTLPAPAQFATECQNKLQHLAPGGWLLDDFVCTPTNITYTWSRQGSTINFLLEQVPNANIDINGNKATFIEPTKQISSNDESLVPFKNSVEPLVSKLQLIGITPRITKIPSPPPPSNNGGGNGTQAPASPNWQVYSFMFISGGLPPADLAITLSYPGTRFNKLSYRAGDWTIEGVIYVKEP